MSASAGAESVARAAQDADVDPRDVAAMVAEEDGEQGGLITILGRVQSRYGYLPEAALRAVAERTGKSLVDIYGVATFFRSFSLRPRGRHVICACLGTACHVRGAPAVVDELERQLGIEAGETTPDMEFTLETVNCLGACALGPVVVVDGRYFSKMRTSRVRQLLADARVGFEQADVCEDERIFPIQVSCPSCNHSLMDASVPIDGHPSIRVTVAFDGRHGWVRLSSLYGSYNVVSEHDIPQGTVVSFLCPQCHADLAGTEGCPACGAPMVPMIVRGGGVVRICSRRGCRSHILDLV